MNDWRNDLYYNEPYIDHIYSVIKLETSEMDAIYGDYIKQLIGVFGFNSLYSCKLIESCGVVNGRQLFVLCDMPRRGADPTCDED
jgi:hypothetical protein